jgi:hypothetical protein
MKNNSNKQQHNKYVPPSKLNLTKKREPKKEFSLTEHEESAFPALTISNNNLKPLLSFANATKNKEVNKDTTDLITSDVIPGWVHIRLNDGKIEYKYGKSTDRYRCSDDNFENRLSSIICKNRLAKEQYERDNDIYRLGDLSDYYGEKTIYELFEEEENLLYNNNSDSDNSSFSETEYESYVDTYENNKFEINGQ